MQPYVTDATLKQKGREWLDHISAFNTHAMQLDVAHAALMVIDMQPFFLNPASPSYTIGGPALIPTLQGMISAFRKAKRPVIYTRHVHHPGLIDAGIMEWWWKGMCKEGTPESEVTPELAPLPGEKTILKHRYSSFYNTDLETILRVQGITDLVITGIMTNMCCESTARDAYYRDYRVFFTADGTGSVTEEMHVATLLNLGFGFARIVDCASMVEAVGKSG